MRLKCIEEHAGSFQTDRLCHVMDISPRGLRAFRSRPVSRRPRITEKLKEIGLDVGHRPVGRLMRQNGISVVRSCEHKVTTDSDHKVNIAPNLRDRDFTADAANRKWAGKAPSLSNGRLLKRARGAAQKRDRSNLRISVVL